MSAHETTPAALVAAHKRREAALDAYAAAWKAASVGLRDSIDYHYVAGFDAGVAHGQTMAGQLACISHCAASERLRDTLREVAAAWGDYTGARMLTDIPELHRLITRLLTPYRTTEGT